MNAINGPLGKANLLTTLWIFVTVNYIYCDLIGVMDPSVFRYGHMGAIDITQGFLLAAAVLVEIPMAMIFLSRILGYRANRWANIVAGAVMTVVQAGSLFAARPTLYYVFFSAIEVACTLFIVVIAWRWLNPESASKSDQVAMAKVTT